MTLNPSNPTDSPVARIMAQSKFARVIVWAIMFLFFVTISNEVLADEKELQKITQEYYNLYKEFRDINEKLKVVEEYSKEEDELRYRKDFIQRRLDNLSYGIKNLGGDVIAIKQKVRGVKVLSGEKIKVSIDGTEKEYKTPEDYKPWPVPDWPVNARAMHNKDFITRLRILEYSPTKWSKDKRWEIERWSVSYMKKFFLKLIKQMYIKDEGVKNWKQVLKKRKATPQTFFKDAEEFEGDVKRLTRAWAVGSFKNEIIKDVFDAHGMGESKSKLVDWNWLDSVLQIEHVRRDYENAQMDLRRVLLEKNAEWDKESSVLWDGKIANLQNIIIESERKMVWLLGYSDDKKFEKMKSEENFKKTALITAQKELLKAYYPKKWFTRLNELIKGTPASMDIDLAGKPTNKKKTAKEYMDKYVKRYKESEKTLVVVRTTIKNGSKYGVMRSGILRTIELGYPKMHLYKRSDDFYKKILGADEYDRLDKNFPVLKQHSVYMQFLPNKRERANFYVQERDRAHGR